MPFLKRNITDISRSKRIQISSYRQGLRDAIFNPSGGQYKGDWDKDVKCGKGVMISKRNVLYQGDFQNNHRHGFGVMAHQLPNKVFQLDYRGEWKNGKMHGYGWQMYPDGGYFIGKFKYGKRDGYGQMWYPDGAFYAGNWVKGKRQGEGMLVNVDGNRYEGQWLRDLKDGEGTYFHLDSGQMQEGLWKKDFCIFSTIADIPYRQKSNDPTPFALKECKLNKMDKLCEAIKVNLATSGDPCSKLSVYSEESIPSVLYF